jgi:hypothetical protein
MEPEQFDRLVGMLTDDASRRVLRAFAAAGEEIPARRGPEQVQGG